MNRYSLSILLGAVAILAVGTSTYVADALSLPMLVPTYALELDYNDNTFVLDHDMSLVDCMDHLPRGDPYKGTSFSCVIED